MTPPREQSAVVAAWLEEGPTELPESTRRAIAVDVRTTRQSPRSSWFPSRFRSVDRLSLVALAAVAVMVVAVAGLAISRIDPDAGNVGGPPTLSASPSASPSPTPSPTPPPSPTEPPVPEPTTIDIPVLSASYDSRLHGYSIRYPAGWFRAEGSQLWSPPAWKAGGSYAPFDELVADGGSQRLRAASAQLPEGLPDVDAWIDEFLTFGDPNCVPPRERQERITIDGAPGRLRDACGEIEATVVIAGRVYMFTLFFEGGPVVNDREMFDEMAATIDLRPEDAVLPSPSP